MCAERGREEGAKVVNRECCLSRKGRMLEECNRKRDLKQQVSISCQWFEVPQLECADGYLSSK